MQLGDEFEILTATGGVSGTFGSTMLTPLGSRRAWAVIYNPPSVVLRVVPGSSFAAADFDEDGDVDGDGLTRWRNNSGTGTTRTTGDADGDADSDGAVFLTWQRHVGSVPALGAATTVRNLRRWT